MHSSVKGSGTTLPPPSPRSPPPDHSPRRPSPPPVPDRRVHLELLHKVLPDGDAGAGVAQDDLKVLLQCQARAHVGQPLVGDSRQRRAGHPQQDHQPVAAGALLRGVEEVLRDLQRLHRRVVLHPREAAHGHHGGGVVLHKNKRPDHRAVQAGEPATRERAGRDPGPCHPQGHPGCSAARRPPHGQQVTQAISGMTHQLCGLSKLVACNLTGKSLRSQLVNCFASS